MTTMMIVGSQQQQQQQQQQQMEASSLMMIAQQFFQQQQEEDAFAAAAAYDEVCFSSSSSQGWWCEDESQQQQQQEQHQHQQHRHQHQQQEEQQQEQSTSVEDILFDLSPPRTPQRAELLLGGGDSWMDSFVSELVAAGEGDEAIGVAVPALEEVAPSPQSSGALESYYPPCTPDDIWRDHFGLNLEKTAAATTTTSSAASEQQQQEQWTSPGEQQVVELLVGCVDDIQRNQAAAANDKLSQLKLLANPLGDPVERAAAHFADGLEAKLSGGDGGGDGGEDGSDEAAMAYKTLDDAVPYLKFAHLTANQALLEATDGARRVHIVDFGTSRGVQWAALLQSFAAASAADGGGGGRSLKITGIPGPELGRRPAAAMLATARRLTEFAAMLGVQNFEFRPILHSLDELSDGDGGDWVEPGEAVAANLVVQLANLSPAGLQRVLSLVHRLNPRIVTVAEFETNGGATCRDRLLCNARFAIAAFESLDAAGLPRAAASRLAAERCFVGGEIRASLQMDASPERREQWKRCVDAAGLWAAGLSNYAASQARLLLWMYKPGDDRLSLVHGPGGCLSLAWRGRPIVTVSAWHC